jgi:hypothetical protein
VSVGFYFFQELLDPPSRGFLLGLHKLFPSRGRTTPSPYMQQVPSVLEYLFRSCYNHGEGAAILSCALLSTKSPTYIRYSPSRNFSELYADLPNIWSRKRRIHTKIVTSHMAKSHTQRPNVASFPAPLRSNCSSIRYGISRELIRCH